MSKCNCVGAHILSCDSINEYSLVFCRKCGKAVWMAEMSFGMCMKCNEKNPHFQSVNVVDCNGMCLLSEWDENKPRDCENCSGRIKVEKSVE